MNSDLDDLKNGWKAFKEISENEEIHTKNQLKEMLKKDSKHVSSRFKRMLWIETSIAILITISFVIIAFEVHGALRLFFSILTLIYIIGCVWLANYLYKFPNQNNIEFSLYDSIQEQIRIAKEFIYIYTKANIILAVTVTPVFFFIMIPFKKGASFYVYFQEMIQDENRTGLVFLSVIAIIHALLATYFTKKTTRWYVKKTYGKYLEQLTTLKAQLTE